MPNHNIKQITGGLVPMQIFSYKSLFSRICDRNHPVLGEQPIMKCTRIKIFPIFLNRCLVKEEAEAAR